MEEEIRQLLGESYKEGMTADEIRDAFKNLVLSSGDYVNKGKAEADKTEMQKKLQAQIDDYKNQLTAKMTDEEKELQAQQAKNEEIKNLKEMLKKSNLNFNKSIVKANLAEAKKMIGENEIEEKYDEFIKNIVFEDEEKTETTSAYINSLIKKAYEKGKADATKDNLGNMGKKGIKDHNSKNDDTESTIGKMLAKSRIPERKQNNYFKGGNL